MFWRSQNFSSVREERVHNDFKTLGWLYSSGWVGINLKSCGHSSNWQQFWITSYICVWKMEVLVRSSSELFLVYIEFKFPVFGFVLCFGWESNPNVYRFCLMYIGLPFFVYKSTGYLHIFGPVVHTEYHLGFLFKFWILLIWNKLRLERSTDVLRPTLFTIKTHVIGPSSYCRVCESPSFVI